MFMSRKDRPVEVMGAIASLESGGNVTGAIRYDAIGPLCPGHVTGKFSPAVDGHALGGWQVMSDNVGPWAREAGLGNVTPEQFLADPKLQQQIVGFQIQKLESQGYSVQDIASIWQSGRPLAAAAAAGANDGNMSTVRYAQTVQRHYDELGNMPSQQTASTAIPPGVTPHTGNHRSMAVASSQSSPTHTTPPVNSHQVASSTAKPTKTGAAFSV